MDERIGRHRGISHIVPGHSAAYSLRRAIRSSGRDDRLISFPDDLSCGPIAADDVAARRLWWSDICGDVDADLDDFWRLVASTQDRLVIWFGRHSARELAFFLAMVDRLGDRPYDIIDVTGLRLPKIEAGGGSTLSRPKQAISLIDEDELALLFGTERKLTHSEREEATRQWHRLKSENAPFRIVTDRGLASAPADVFDKLLLEHARRDWRKAALVIGQAMFSNMEPYIQVGDMMLIARMVALVDQGKLLACGNPWAPRECEVRLPD